MNNDYFTFRGVDSGYYGIVLQEPLRLSPAVPKVTTSVIPGRNGDLHTFEGTYENRSITARCYILKSTTEALEAQITSANAWLTRGSSYYRFVDSNDPSHFMLARPVQGIEKSVRGGLLNPFELEFDAKPQRFREDGETAYIVTSSIYNPTSFPSRPILRIEASESGYVSFKSGTLNFSTGGTFIYDAETDDAKFSNDINANSLVMSRGIIELRQGDNQVSMRGVTSLQITPRWWEI